MNHAISGGQNTAADAPAAPHNTSSAAYRVSYAHAHIIAPATTSPATMNGIRPNRSESLPASGDTMP